MADHQNSPVKILAWVLPRTISTALTKCLSSLEDMEIFFELFLYSSFVRKVYEAQTGDDMPMNYDGNEEKVLEAIKRYGSLINTDLVPERVVYSDVNKAIQSSDKKYIFVKEAYMAFPDEKSRQYLPTGFRHVFLIREPYRLLASYRDALYRHMTNVGMRSGDSVDKEAFDMEHDDPITNTSEFYRKNLEFFKYIRDNLDPNPIIINTDDLLANPAEMLKKFCHLTGLPYSDSLLKWDESSDIIKTWKTASEDIINLSIAFYETAVFSRGFHPPKPAAPIENITPDVIKLANASMPYYQELNKYKI
nr:uncharacterized protein LOC129279207 [Lytechinus pictus]